MPRSALRNDSRCFADSSSPTGDTVAKCRHGRLSMGAGACRPASFLCISLLFCCPVLKRRAKLKTPRRHPAQIPGSHLPATLPEMPSMRAAPDPSLAVGLDLPRPGSSVRFALEGHCRVFAQASSSEVRRAALATGGTGWHYAAKVPRATKPWPSMSHLVWTCPALAADRAHLPNPENRALPGRS